jgi:hypothetical protein
VSGSALQKSREFLAAELEADEAASLGGEGTNEQEAESEPSEGDALPFSGMGEPDPDEGEGEGDSPEPAAAEADAPSAPSGEVLFESIDGKKFQSADELRTYVRELEKKQLAAEVRGKPEPKPEPKAGEEEVPSALSGLNLDELFVNPQKVLAELAKNVRAEVLKEVETKADVKDYWSGFYTRHSHFKGLEDVIDIAYTKMVAEIGEDKMRTMKRDELEKILVKKADDFVGKVRGQEGQVLTKKKPVVLSSQKGSAPKAPAAKTQDGPKNFVEQMQEHREARLKGQK